MLYNQLVSFLNNGQIKTLLNPLWQKQGPCRDTRMLLRSQYVSASSCWLMASDKALWLANTTRWSLSGERRSSVTCAPPTVVSGGVVLRLMFRRCYGSCRILVPFCLLILSSNHFFFYSRFMISRKIGSAKTFSMNSFVKQQAKIAWLKQGWGSPPTAPEAPLHGGVSQAYQLYLEPSLILSLVDDMRIPARVSQWVKLIKMPLHSIQALVRFVQEFLFKVSVTHTTLLLFIYYILSTLPHW